MLDLLLAPFGIHDLREVMQELSGSENPRKRIAAVTPIVMKAAEQGDDLALQLLSNGAGKLADLVTAVAKSLGFLDGYPLALAGGAILGSRNYREKLLACVETSSPVPGPVTVVEEPVLGCLYIGRTHLGGRSR